VPVISAGDRGFGFGLLRVAEEFIDGDWLVGRKWAGDSKGDIRRLIYGGNSGGILARGCCGRWNWVEGRRLCGRVNGSRQMEKEKLRKPGMQVKSRGI
jgi:hypothetical protein